MEIRTTKILSDELTMHVAEVGEGRPLICLHGGGPGAFGISNYRDNLAALAPGRRVILPDLPGYGASDKPELVGPRLAFFSRHVRNMMDNLGIDQADFIGNSLGGGTATKLAMDTPDRARRLILLGPAIGFPIFTPFPTEGWRHMAGYYRGAGPSVEKMRAWLNVLVANPTKITETLAQERYEASIQPDLLSAPLNEPGPKAPFEQLWAEGIGKVEHRVLLLWGRDDRVVPMESGFAAFKQLPNAEFHIFANTGHWVQFEQAEAFNRLSVEFLDRP